MSSTADFTAYVMGHHIKDGKQAGHQGQLGACPYSARVLLTLEEKQIPYEIEYINVNDKPKWLLDVNPKGTVPVVKYRGTDGYIYDSDTICDYLEDKYGPEADISKKVLGKLVDCRQPGAQLWDKFMEYLKSDAAQEGLKEQLRQIEGAITNESPFVGGKDVCGFDMALAPKLYLARIGCQDLKGWDFTEEFTSVKQYLHRMTGRASWRNMQSWDEESIVQDLKHKLQKTEK